MIFNNIRLPKYNNKNVQVQSYFFDFVDHAYLLYFCLPVVVLEICHAFFPIQKTFHA